MSRTQAIKRINDAYSRLDYACGSSSNWNRYLSLIEAEETQHRQFKPDGLACGLTRAVSVRLFAVKNIFGHWVSEGERESVFVPGAQDFFFVKTSIFGACALAHECSDRILAEFPLAEMKDWLRSVDYVELNRDTRALVAA